MALPDTSVDIAEGSPSGSAGADTGTAFMIGLTDRGPVDEARLVRSLSTFERHYGPRVSYGQVYDAVEAFFREGGARLYVGRIVGPGATTSTVDLSSGATPTLTVNATSPGGWGDLISVGVVAGDTAGTYILEVSYDGTLVESSPELADNAEAVAWAEDNSRYIRLEDLGEGNPDTGTSSLAGGDDDRANAGDTETDAALALFGADLGTGQVLYPGATDQTSWEAVLAHAESHGRIGLLDGDDTPTAANLITDASTLRSGQYARHGAMFAPWAIVPGVTRGTTRTVPYSAVQAGLIGRLMKSGVNPNVPAAGESGVCDWVVGLSQPAWSDADRESLNDAGVNVAVVKQGNVRTYGYRTLANPTTDANWTSLASARLAKSIAWRADQIAEKYLFAQLDGKGITISEFAGELQGMLLGDYQDGALFGSTPDEAYEVDVGEGVNPPEDIADGKLSAALRVRMSPYAEQVEITITKVATEEAV